jgi:hypothetical protein
MTVAESIVCKILQNPLDHNGWTIQGLGMLRLELDSAGRERLHIWDPGTALNDAASAHDHPWDINESRIYFGSMSNQRYERVSAGGFPMQEARVMCGVGSHLVGEPRPVLLDRARPLEHYDPGDSYSMRAEEFHNSFPTPGAVTVIHRTFRPDRNIATICWSGGGSWNQDGFTRVATKEEILHFTGLANQNR